MLDPQVLTRVPPQGLPEAGPQSRLPASLFARARRLASVRSRALPLMAPAPVPGRARALRQDLSRRKYFYLIVVLPTLLTTVYMALIASKQYVSEAHFIVHSAQKQNVGGLGAMLQGAGLSGIRDDTASVADYIRSRDALREVDEQVDLRAIVNRPGADFLARFPTFYDSNTFEELFDHFSNIVTVIHDTTTGINTLKVRTFTPEDSKAVVEALLRASEALVNRMNARSLEDAVALARHEVANAEKRSAAAQVALTEHRVLVGQVDSTSTAKIYLELIGGLEKELATTRAQLTQMLVASPNNPSIPNQRDRIGALERQVASERRKLLGSNGGLVGSFAEFERLTLEAEFAAKAVVVANTMLESARVDALRKQLYLDRIVEPNAADLSRYPRRILSILTVFGTMLLAYGILWLVRANAREHAN